MVLNHSLSVCTTSSGGLSIVISRKKKLFFQHGTRRNSNDLLITPQMHHGRKLSTGCTLHTHVAFGSEHLFNWWNYARDALPLYNNLSDLIWRWLFLDWIITSVRKRKADGLRYLVDKMRSEVSAKLVVTSGEDLSPDWYGSIRWKSTLTNRDIIYNGDDKAWRLRATTDGSDNR